MRIKIPKTTFGRNVWYLRLWWNWDITQLARSAHVPVSLIRQVERDKGDPRLSQIRALAETLKVNVGDLLKHGAELISVSEQSRERIHRKIRRGTTNECWIWTGARQGAYGNCTMNGERCYPHRLVYAMDKPLMKNCDLDHICNNPLCVNPEHLEVVTRGTNLNRRDHRSNQRVKKSMAN